MPRSFSRILDQKYISFACLHCRSLISVNINSCKVLALVSLSPIVCAITHSLLPYLVSLLPLPGSWSKATPSSCNALARSLVPSIICITSLALFHCCALANSMLNTRRARSFSQLTSIVPIKALARLSVAVTLIQFNTKFSHKALAFLPAHSYCMNYGFSLLPLLHLSQFTA